MLQAVVITCIAVAILLLILLANYNALMQLRQQVRLAWADMDAQLKRRYDLVPRLISAVQSAGGPAVARLPAVRAAKNQAAIAFSPAQLALAESALSAAIADVLQTMTSDTASNPQPEFVLIQRQLQECDKQIAASRDRYNDLVDQLNTSLSNFPQVMTAKAIGLRTQPSLHA